MRCVAALMFTAALVLAAAGCDVTGPSETLTGTWTASTGTSSFIGMNLEQTGDEISGTACARSDGVLLYHRVPVAGEDSRVAFSVAANYTQPCCANLAGTRFSGRLDGSGHIVGRLGNVDIRFERSTTDTCR